MNKKTTNIDKYTGRLIKQGGNVEPSADFTQNVMSQIVKDPAVKFNFSMIKDDKESKIWLLISIAAMFVGYFLFFFFKNGFNLEQSVNSLSSALYIQTLSDLFSQIYYELSFSPYVFIGLAGVLLLVLIDKTLIKLLHSI
ncbi:MAG: hypothetical protein ACQERU_10315 [Bacteroidota bacterium]